ncbi:MAG TPA: thioredoxin domain-containing protein [Chloroflexota bacterium]|nr:thioredoxin domain-containing protein [Chloroflexota bacterium]
MANRLAGETSPYLQQHAGNPVDWYPWGSEALARARAEDRPILVSIGYSACHWCHVMAHESFEDPETAALMNEAFVNVKVDREERPDVDCIYMEAVQALTGHGGWPLNVFLTPDGRPFFGGTYFPPVSRHGMPSWKSVLVAVRDAYRDRREDVLQNAEALTSYVRQAQNLPAGEGVLAVDVLRRALETLSGQFDWSDGGFGSAPKFPQPLTLDLLLRLGRRLHDTRALDFVQLTLDRMAAGGIHDQLGGGFHRYSVDGYWLVPHFEKMLYDNALLAMVYLHAFLITGSSNYRLVTEQTLDYVLRELRSPEGGFFSAQDADSEGVEGKYYVWTPDEIDSAAGPAAELAILHFGVTAGGNFDGRTILTSSVSPAQIAQRTGEPLAAVQDGLERARKALLAARTRRVPPATDTKVLTSWNALAIRALAEAGRSLQRPDYTRAAEDAARFLLTALRPAGALLRSWQGAASGVPAFLEDHAYLAEALISLYEVTGRVEYYHEARGLSDEMEHRFGDEAGGGYFDAPLSEDLVVRPRSFFDNPIPSGNASAASALLRLAALDGDTRHTASAERILRSAGELLHRAPQGVPYLLSALDSYLAGTLQVAIVGTSGQELAELADVVFGLYLPERVLAAGRESEVPLLDGRMTVGGKATAYLCEHFACRLPVTKPEELRAQLEERYAAG